MFFRRKKQCKKEVLSDFVKKTHGTEYVFLNINNDLGRAVESGVDDWPPLLFMAYGYARRAAISALYIQGLVDKDLFEHVKVMFIGFQQQTDPTYDFQEKAAAESIKFMSEYSPLINSFIIKKIVQVSEEYEIPSGTLSDAELMENVIDTAYFEQSKYSSESNNSVNDVVKNITEGVNNRIGSKGIALQFVLEELEAARQGNEAAIKFVENSGFSPSEYEGAMQNSIEEVDGPDGPQQFLLSSLMQFSSDMDFMVNLRLQVVENIINGWELNTHREGRIDKLFQSLKNILEDDESVMPALAPNIPVPATAKANHIHFAQKNISSAKSIVSTLSKITGDDTDTIVKRSLRQNSTPEESTATQDEIISKLSQLSDSNNIKTCRMKIQPIHEIWSWEFEFSDDELETAEELVSVLYDLRNGDFIAPVFNIVKRQDSPQDFNEDIPF